MNCIRMLKLPEVERASGLKSTSVYALAKTGLMVPPVKLTPRSSAWPEHEIDAINRARIAGKSDDEIRQLVKELLAARSRVDSNAAA